MRYSKLIGLVASITLVVAPLQECTTPPTPGPTTTTTAPGETTTTVPGTTTDPSTTTTVAPTTVPTTPTTDCSAVPTTDSSLIPNGDFNENYVDLSDTGAPGTTALRAYAPAPWGINQTPDFSTDANISFNANGGTPRAGLAGFDSSPTGGSFMGFRSVASNNNEGIYNTLQIDDPNDEITIVFDYTEYNLTLFSQIVDPGVNVQFRLGIDPTANPVDTTGTVIQNVANLASTGGAPGTWEQRRITFTPAQLGFTTPGNYNFYLGAKDSVVNTWAFVDGLVVIKTQDLCPPETTTTTIATTTTTTCSSAPSTSRSLIPNGDFNENYVDVNNPGTPGTNSQRIYAPAPWGINQTPDFSTDDEINFNSLFGTPRTGQPGFNSSPTGGSFMGFRSIGAANEGIYNTLQIDDPNEEITIVFDYTEYTANQPNFVAPGVNVQFRLGINPGGILVDTTGTVIQNVANLASTGGTPGTWEQRRITFTPAQLGFTTPGNYDFYLGAKDSAIATWAFVDGLVVIETQDICEPEPTPPTTTTVPIPPTTDCASAPSTSRSLIPNGDFNENYVDPANPGTAGTNAQRAYAPAPWGVNQTPDFSTDAEISFNTGGTPRPAQPGFNSSPTGGSFMGFRSIGASNNEGIYNTLQIDDPNEEITIVFDYTEYTAFQPNFVASGVNVQFRLGINPTANPVDDTGTAIQDVANLAATGGTPGTWEQRRITFTPAQLGFTTPGNYNFYLGAKASVTNTWAFVDGLVVIETQDICEPEPTPPPTTTTTVPTTTTTVPTTTTTVPTTTTTIPTTTTTTCSSAPSTSRSLIPNGDFNENYVDPANPGVPGTNAQRAYAPAPWGINSTPDFSTDAEVSFNDAGNRRAGLAGFGPSPAGGSFLGFRTADGEEGIYNTLQVDDPNEEMTIVFQYTEYDETSASFTPGPTEPGVNVQFRLGINPFAPQVDTTGTVIQDVPNLRATGGTPGTWEERRITFTPAQLGFATPGSYNFYLGAKNSVRDTWAFVDGLVVVISRDLCPPPTTAPPTTQPS